MEEWKVIEDFPDYQISNQGRVRSLYYRKKSKTPNLQLLKPSIGNHGYPVVNIKKKVWTVHRFVAKAFIPNPNNLPCIDHIDRNRTNNKVENLRWVSYSENLCNKQTRTNHYYIHKTEYNKYCVRIAKLGICKNFETLDEALEFRDSQLSPQINLTPLNSPI